MKYLLFISMFVFSCTTSTKIQEQKVDKMVILYNEGKWASNFKNMVFSNILTKMYGKEFVECCLKKDASETANFDWLNFDTAISNIAFRLSNDFMKRPYLSGDIEGRKVMLNYALKYRTSSELDSITGVYYHQFQMDSILKSKIEN